MAKIDEVLAAVQNLDGRIDAMIQRVEALLSAQPPDLDAQLQQVLDITTASTAKVDAERP